MNRILIVIFSLLLICCQQNKSSSPADFAKEASAILKYAEGFRITELDNVRMVEVLYPFQGATTGYKYLLVPKDQKVPPHAAGIRVIRTPITSIVCTSTTHIPLLDYLNETDKLIGFPTPDFISSPKMRERINSGNVEDLGIDKGMNLEKLAMLKPDLLMGYAMTGDYGQFKKMEQLGVPVVLNAEYLEKHPLGRAEWIKFMALFFNKEAMADSVFDVIEKNYMETKALTNQTAQKPTVLSGILYGDAWFLPGGQNYASNIFKDAGYDYLWSDDPSHGFLELSFESVYERAHNADLWIGVGNFSTLQQIRDADNRYSLFRPFKEKKIYTYDGRKGEKGGSEFLELGYLRPDIILKDLVKIAHPDQLPGYELYFHKRLE